FFSNDKSYVIPRAPFDLLALLNSKVAWFFITGVSPAVRGGFHELRVHYIEKIPIPTAAARDRERLATLAQECTGAACRRLERQSCVRRRILGLAGPARAK